MAFTSVKKDCCARKHANFNLGQTLHTVKDSETFKLKTKMMMMTMRRRRKITNLLYVAARHVNACILSNK